MKKPYRLPLSLAYRCHPVPTVAAHFAAYGWYMDSRPSRRTENRTLLEVGVTLASLDLVTYEVTTTRDVSLHGASVLTKQHWPSNQRLDVRSLHCQSKLATPQGDLTDEQKKTAALTKERDDALRIARGGSAWRRIGRAAKWFLIGATAGAIAVKAAH